MLQSAGYSKDFVRKGGIVLLTTLLASLSMVIAPKSSKAATTTCSTVSCVTTAVANAQPGDIINLADGVTFNGKFTLAANGTAANPITLQTVSSTNRATINAGTTSTGYGLTMTGDYWIVKNVKVTNAKKGIMLDNANYTLIDNVEVYNIGEEGVHYRDGSSYNTIQYSNIHDCGVLTPDYGEGVYVGSDVGKWGTYNAATNYNKIKNNTIGPNVKAEHIDIKEGSTGTIVEYNTFNGTGISGANSADSFMDVKGNNDIIRYNTGYRNNNSIIVNAFEVHQRSAGWGQNADFYGNTVYLDNATPNVVYTDSNGTAKASNNTRSPVGNMYSGNVTQY